MNVTCKPPLMEFIIAMMFMIVMMNVTDRIESGDIQTIHIKL